MKTFVAIIEIPIAKIFEVVIAFDFVFDLLSRWQQLHIYRECSKTWYSRGIWVSSKRDGSKEKVANAKHNRWDVALQRYYPPPEQMLACGSKRCTLIRFREDSVLLTG